ncbi:MAG: trans-2-enoyl-CoA reductase family protein [Lachnospiraceae bacterium]|nr:trans-2-enoyl-CoA reductase family protein [Lachnospiraceae bacterium]
MIVKPKVREFICTTAHPAGCAKNVRIQIEKIEKEGMLTDGPKKALIIGASTGYGLATRIVTAFGAKAATLGVMFEREAQGKRTATPGWYNTKAFENEAKAAGIYAKTLNGDAFSKQIKQEVIETIKEDLGQVDLVVYSLAAPKRMTEDGVLYSSVLKTTGAPFTNKSLNLKDNTISEKTVDCANEDEILNTVKVMGGEDWMDWMDALVEAGVLASNAKTVAYSYIGPELTYPIYNQGTIGQAKKHLAKTARDITEKYADKGIKGYISVNKALVTQASAAIPIVPLYIAIMYDVMKKQGLHEGCLEQMDRLFREKNLMGEPKTDESGLIRLDDWELKEEVQTEIMRRYGIVDSDNVKELADIEGYWEDFYQMFGFLVDGVDYEADVEV